METQFYLWKDLQRSTENNTIVYVTNYKTQKQAQGKTLTLVDRVGFTECELLFTGSSKLECMHYAQSLMK
jgi:hypothetical protein